MRLNRPLGPKGVDAVVALLLFALMAAELAAKAPQAGEPATSWYAYVWAALITLPIAVHRRFPTAAVVTAAVGIVGYSAGHFVAFPGYAAFALVFLVSLHTARGRGVLAFAVLAAAVGVALAGSRSNARSRRARRSGPSGCGSPANCTMSSPTR
jgi:hypothetical protein